MCDTRSASRKGLHELTPDHRAMGATGGPEGVAAKGVSHGSRTPKVTLHNAWALLAVQGAARAHPWPATRSALAHPSVRGHSGVSLASAWGRPEVSIWSRSGVEASRSGAPTRGPTLRPTWGPTWGRSASSVLNRSVLDGKGSAHSGNRAIRRVADGQPRSRTRNGDENGRHTRLPGRPSMTKHQQ